MSQRNGRNKEINNTSTANSNNRLNPKKQNKHRKQQSSNGLDFSQQQSMKKQPVLTFGPPEEHQASPAQNFSSKSKYPGQRPRYFCPMRQRPKL